jgi:hypothetical protein
MNRLRLPFGGSLPAGHGAELVAADGRLGPGSGLDCARRGSRAIPPDREPTPSGRSGGEGGLHAIASRPRCPPQSPDDGCRAGVGSRDSGSSTGDSGMTEQKHLKKLVRDRMARTSETYTTARRNVLAKVEPSPSAERKSLPAGLVRDYDVFGGGQHRESTLVAHLLRQAGYRSPHTGEPYTEAMVCGLAGGIGFMYAIFEYANVPPMVTIVAQHHPEPWLPGALGRLAIPYIEEHSGKPERALAALHSALDDGRAVFCAVDGTQLPWRAGQFGLSTEPHNIVIAGHADGAVYVDDHDESPLPLAEPQFAQAWSGYRKGRHHRITVVPGAEVDLPAAIRRSIATTVAHLTGPVLGNYFDGNFGFSGMGRLSAALLDQRTKNGWLKRFEAPGAFATVVPRLHDCLELQYTGPGATRPLYGDFLREAARVLEDERLVGAAALFGESAEVWSAIAGRAAEMGDSLGGLADLAARRMHIVMTQGAAARDEIRALSADIEASADDLHPEDARREFFLELGELAQTARSIEERAVALLSE